jgi:membrane fusion protein (multidrug efflux system)
MILLSIGLSCSKDDKGGAEDDMAQRRKKMQEMREKYEQADSATKAQMRAEFAKRRAEKMSAGEEKKPGDQDRRDPQAPADAGQRKKPDSGKGEHPGMAQGGGQGEALIPVEVSSVQRRDMADYILASTTLEALREIEIYAKTTGIIEKLLVEEGDIIGAGDTLVVLDEREAKLSLRKAEISYREAQNALNRAKEMSTQDLISREEYETTQLAFESSKASLEEAKLAYEYTRVIAPIAGTITDRFIELGDMITQSKILFQLADFNPLRARIFIPERELPRLEVGQEVLLNIESAPGREFPAIVQLISSVVDPSSGTFKVTIEVKSSGGDLRPGMFASARIIVDRHLNTKVVPAEAILYEGSQRYIYVVRDGAAARIDLEAGYADQGCLEVLGPVEEGEKVVVAGQNNLASGTKVEIVRDVTGGNSGKFSHTGDSSQASPRPSAGRGNR